MKIGLLQFSPEWENKENNILKVKELLEKDTGDTDLILLPEMTFTGFTMNTKHCFEDIDGPAKKYLIHASSKLRKNIISGFIEKEEERFINTAIHFNEYGLIAAKYKKIHPFSLGKEDEHYSAGNEIVITTIDKVKIGLSICYDLRFPELYRLYGKQRVDIIINIANWPEPRINHWKLLLRARAIENQCFAVGINRIGNDPAGMYYPGASAIYDPMGEEVLLADESEGIFSAVIDLEKVKDVRDKFHFLDDIKLI